MDAEDHAGFCSRTDTLELHDADAPHLLAYLAGVPNPRATRGRRHRLVAILGLAARCGRRYRRLAGPGHPRDQPRTDRAQTVPVPPAG